MLLPILVNTWYRSESPVALLGVFEDIIGKVDVKGLEFYLLGDINHDMLPGPTDHNTYHLNIRYIYGLNQLIKELTRVTGSTSQLK